MTELLRRKRQCSDLSFSGIAQIPLGYKKSPSPGICAPGGLYAVSVPAGAGDCGSAVRRRGAVSLPQDRQDESGGGAEE